ncbi:MAG: sensor histidine kinase [Bacteroidia bacterium]|nr:sensor histidine kinase [Bacteroidia bacterium]
MRKIRSVINLLLWYIFLPAGFALPSLAASPSDTIKINQLLKQSLSLQRVNEDSCYTLAAEAYKLAQQINYPKGIRGAFIRMGSVLMTRGYNDSALAFINQAIVISQSLKDYRSVAQGYILKSYIVQAKGQKDSAFASLYQSLQYSEKIYDTATIISTHTAMGDMNFDYKEYGRALQQYETALALAQSNRLIKERKNALAGKGNVLYKQNQYAEALRCYLQIDSVSKFIHDDIGNAQNLNNIALCYAGLKQEKKALVYYTLALDAYKKFGMKSEEANLYYNIAILYKDINLPDSAIYFLTLSNTLATEIQEPEQLMEGYKLLAEIWAGKGDYLKAYRYHVQYNQLNDSMLTVEKIASISEMQTKYDTEKKEQQIVLLDQQNKTKAAQRNALIAGSAVLLLALFVLGFYYIQRNKIARKNQEIAEQKIVSLLNETELKTYNAMIEGQEEERKRIATDLHDRLGSMLATVKLLFSSLDSKIDRMQKENNEQFATAKSLLDEACGEVRRISHNLSSGIVMSFGLVPALEELCHSVDQSKLIKCKLMAYGMDERLDQTIELGVYRMVQELFSNILKHAKAHKVTVQLNHIEGSLNVTVEDDGVGFDVEEKRKSGGMGLHNLEKRAAQLNGIYTVDSRPGKGTISIIEIPTTI